MTKLPKAIETFTVGQTVRIVDTSMYAGERVGTLGNDGYVTLAPSTTGEVIAIDKLTEYPIFRPHGWPVSEEHHIRGYIFSPLLLQAWDGPQTHCRLFCFNSNGKKIFKAESPKEFEAILKAKLELIQSNLSTTNG